ncbi:Vitamin K-dependent gamma-carboxylase [compost metagenome]
MVEIRQGITDPIIKVDSRMSLNGRPYQRALDPNVDFAKAKMKYFTADEWILPLDPHAERGTLSRQQYEGHDEAKDEE